MSFLNDILGTDHRDMKILRATRPLTTVEIVTTLLFLPA